VFVKQKELWEKIKSHVKKIVEYYSYWVKSSQVTFICIALFKNQIISVEFSTREPPFPWSKAIGAAAIGALSV